MKNDATKSRTACAAIRYRNRSLLSRRARPLFPGRERGVALIAVMLLALVSLAIGIMSAMSSRTELKIAHNDVLDKRALAVAEAGLNEARQRIAAHGVLNDELAVNPGGGACTGNGVGNASSGLFNISNTPALLASDGLCYRSAVFPAGSTDRYYVRVEDNHDEASGTDAPLADIDSTIYIISHGVVGTAERIVKGLYTIVVAQSVYASHDLKISGSTIGSQTHPLRIGSGGTISQDSPPGSGSSPLLCNGGTSRCAVYGSATYATTVADATKFSQGVTQAAAQTLTPVTACGPPWSANSGITPNTVYNASTGVLSSNNVVIIAPGTYCFSQITVSSNSGRLEVDGPSPTIINLTGSLTFSGGAQVNNTTSNPDNLIVNTSSTSTSAVTVSGGSGTYMRINAPNPTAKVTISGGASAFNGTVKTYDFVITGGATLLDDSATTTATLDNWREVQN